MACLLRLSRDAQGNLAQGELTEYGPGEGREYQPPLAPFLRHFSSLMFRIDVKTPIFQ